MRPQLFLVLAVCTLVAADTANDDVKKELKKFEGTWIIESLEIDGQKVPADTLKGTKLTCKDDTFTMTDPMATYKGTFKVDITKKPKQIDIHFTDGPEKGNTIKGIYELEGDTYKVCMPLMGSKERPTEFSSKGGGGLEVLKREKSK